MSSVSTVEPAPGYPVLEIDHPTCVALVARHGAHVMEWRPRHTADPVLYLSPDAVFREGKAIRGGIPLCWPWFGAHPTDASQPSHGFARTAFWTHAATDEDEAGVTLRFSFEKDGLTALAALRLGETLTVSLETTNRRSEPAPLSGALHSYLKVGDIRAVCVGGLEGSEYLDTTGTPVWRRQRGAVTITEEVDRNYDSSRSCRLVDDALGRILVIEKEGSPTTVVWNPWIEKAAALGDLPDEGYRDFLCIEAAIANDRAVKLAPGESHTLSTTIRLA